jgi:hypothetical protein
MTMLRTFTFLAVVLAGAQTCVIAADQASAGPDLSGVWLLDRTVPALRSVDGAALPFTAEGRAAYQAVMADRKAGKTQDLTRKYCLPDGVPRLLTARAPFEIVQTPGQVTFLHEARHIYRALPVDGPPIDPNLLIESYMGNANARWDGAVLVIDSVGFNTETWLDDSGLQHSEELQTTERWQKLAGGRQLQVDVSITDPRYFMKPWTTRFTFSKRSDLGIVEYVCGEPHRSFAGKGAK